MSRKRRVVLVAVCVLAAGLVLARTWPWLIHGLASSGAGSRPVTGTWFGVLTCPRSGRVLDATTGKPIAGATAAAEWTCHDNPLPDGPGHLPAYAEGTTDADGRFVLAPPARRGGIFQTDFVFRVRAKGYIEAVFIVDPHNVPLPPSTVAWPFADTTVHTSLPATITARLKPAKPVLLKALTSSDKLIRETAREMLRELEPDAAR